MSKPPKDCLRLALRTLLHEMGSLSNMADRNELNLAGMRPEFHEFQRQTVRVQRNKAARLARVAAWIQDEIGDASTTPRHDNPTLPCPAHQPTPVAAQEPTE